MQIKEFSERAGLSRKTIRYYEEIVVLPLPQRLPNGYRFYQEDDLNCVRLVAGARRLDFSLNEVKEIMALRDRNEAPCSVLLELLEDKAKDISRRIEELKRFENELRNLHALGATFPVDDVEGKSCVCHLVSEKTKISI